MAEEINILPIKPAFEQIWKTAEDRKEYWSARQATALGYSTSIWQEFKRVLNKVRPRTWHGNWCLNQTIKMIKLESGSFQEMENWHLSRMACLIITENVDGKRPQVQATRIYFREQISIPELTESQMTPRILIYKTYHGEIRIGHYLMGRHSSSYRRG